MTVHDKVRKDQSINIRLRSAHLYLLWFYYSHSPCIFMKDTEIINNTVVTWCVHLFWERKSSMCSLSTCTCSVSCHMIEKLHPITLLISDICFTRVYYCSHYWNSLMRPAFYFTFLTGAHVSFFSPLIQLRASVTTLVSSPPFFPISGQTSFFLSLLSYPAPHPFFSKAAFFYFFFFFFGGWRVLQRMANRHGTGCTHARPRWRNSHT